MTEGDWTQERRIDYYDKDGRTVITTRLGADGAMHAKESVEETVTCTPSFFKNYTTTS